MSLLFYFDVYKFPTEKQKELPSRLVRAIGQIWTLKLQRTKEKYIYFLPYNFEVLNPACLGTMNYKVRTVNFTSVYYNHWSYILLNVTEMRRYLLICSFWFILGSIIHVYEWTTHRVLHRGHSSFCRLVCREITIEFCFLQRDKIFSHSKK